MSSPATFENFQQELTRLVERFDRGFLEFKSSDYNEATLRADFLDAFFRSLGWDVGNTKGLIHTEREVDIEVRTATSGRQTRADYVFRYARVERFTCEAKKPAEALNDRHIYQAKRDAFNRGVPVALLSDFEELKIYIVGARPHRDEPHVGEFKVLNFRQYPLAARELWDLLAYDNVRAGSIDREIEKLPKRPLKLKGRQGYLIKPDRTRSLDVDFLNFLDDARQQLGSDLLKHNDRADLLTGHRLNEAAQRIIDRLVFLRICEDRGIDTGELLQSLFDHWYRQQAEPPKLRRPGRQSHLRFGGGTDGSDALGDEPGAIGSVHGRIEGSLYRELTGHIRALDHRPATYKPFFNGQLFAAHFSEDLVVGDEWLANFILDLTDDDTGYSFATIKVEILGDAYERFLGKVLRPQGRGATIEEKPEVRKAGGVYYTPRYITDYIVEQTIGRLLEGKSPREVEKLRFVDPACGSGSFLLRAYERVMEHYLRWFIANPAQQKKADCYTDAVGNVRLTTALKRRILVNNIYGVDIDAQAVEVTQLSLYLKMLEDENRDTLRTQTELFRGEALLPPLDKNIRCFNSLIASDFSLDPDELVRVNAGDWDVQFSAIMKAGGFDAVVGNPPWIDIKGFPAEQTDYFFSTYNTVTNRMNVYAVFMHRATDLLRADGYFGFITPNSFLTQSSYLALRERLLSFQLNSLIRTPDDVFDGVKAETAITTLKKSKPATDVRVTVYPPRGKIDSIKNENAQSACTVNQRVWAGGKDKIFNLHFIPAQAELIEKITNAGAPLFDLCEFCLGLTPYDKQKGHSKAQIEGRVFHSTVAKNKAWKPLLEGADITRFYVGHGGKEFIHYGPWLGAPREQRFFTEPRILVRQIISGVPPRIFAGYTESELYNSQIAFNLLCRDPAHESLKYILGILNSSLLTWFHRIRFLDLGKSVFQKILIQDAKTLPFRRIDFSKPIEKQQHDRLVSLVDKMLLLTSALRLAKNDAERRAVENALAKTDQGIDQLVYQLYALTPEEIALVEGTLASGSGAGAPTPATEAN